MGRGRHIHGMRFPFSNMNTYRVSGTTTNTGVSRRVKSVVHKQKSCLALCGSKYLTRRDSYGNVHFVTIQHVLR